MRCARGYIVALLPERPAAGKAGQGEVALPQKNTNDQVTNNSIAKCIAMPAKIARGVDNLREMSLMGKSIAILFFALLSATATAQSQHDANESSKILLASGAVYWAHCDKRCDELRCPDKKACYKACVDNKGTIAMCPGVQGKGK